MENSRIRNFVIISHIDHGKSTLADRFLELTGTISKNELHPQYLDMMDLEQERGITIKMQPVRMEYDGYILNLIDTPGHVDFSYEVSRSLAAVEGAVLLVDATKGIQAQTLANLEQAQKQNLVIIPAVNKIDLPQAQVEATKRELSDLLNISPDDIFEISAKLGTNVEELLKSVIKNIPPPRTDINKALRALIFDSEYDSYQGVIAYVRIVDGRLTSSDNIFLIQAKANGKIKELGYFKPKRHPQRQLEAGEIGYLATGIKEAGRVRVGDTIIKISNSKFPVSDVKALPGYKEPKPMVFASIFPASSDDFDELRSALTRLKLNDSALTFEPETKDFLGRGFRCGFLGSLHIEIVCERLKREFGLDLIISTPSVVFKVISQNNQIVFIYTPGHWPSPAEIKEILEPWANLELIVPLLYLGQVQDLLKSIEAKYIREEYLTNEKVLLVYEVPFRRIICGFYDNLKSQSRGFASMNYSFLEYRPADLVKIDIYIAGKKEDAFSKIIDRKEAFKEGKKIVTKLKEILPAQLFSLPIQAAVSGKIIARETIKAKRRDVTAPLYGGDYTRKRKLLERQKRGKKKLKERAKIKIPPRVFLEMFRV